MPPFRLRLPVFFGLAVWASCCDRRRRQNRTKEGENSAQRGGPQWIVHKGMQEEQAYDQARRPFEHGLNRRTLRLPRRPGAVGALGIPGKKRQKQCRA